MYVETNRRSLLKGVTWRLLATSTTILIVFLFFGRLDLALAAGVLETIAKIFLYYLHERAWNQIHFGKKRIEPFNLWVIGLPLSGKRVLADRVYERLLKLKVPLERIDNQEIRTLLPETGYEKQDRMLHIKRVGFLIKKLQRHSVSTVSSFVSPYQESRQAVRGMTENYVEVFIDISPEACKQRDKTEFVTHIDPVHLEDLERIHTQYDRPQNPDIVITENDTLDEAVERIVNHIKKHLIQ